MSEPKENLWYVVILKNYNPGVCFGFIAAGSDSYRDYAQYAKKHGFLLLQKDLMRHLRLLTDELDLIKVENQ